MTTKENLDAMGYDDLSTFSQKLMQERRELKGIHSYVARRMDGFAAEAEAKKIAAKLSPIERAKLRAELESAE